MGVNKNLIIILIIAVVIVIGLFNFYSKQSKETINIALLGNLSKVHSKDALLGANLAVKDINTAGGVNGRKINLLTFDTIGDFGSIDQLANQINNDPTIYGVINTMGIWETYPHLREEVMNLKTSEERIAFFKENRIVDPAERFELPSIILSSSRDFAWPKPKLWWGILHTFVAADQITSALIPIKEEFSVITAAIITDNEGFSKYYTNAFAISARDNNIEIIASYDYSQEELLNIVSSIKELNPDMVVVATSATNSIEFFIESKLQKLNPKVILIGDTAENQKSIILQNEDLLPDNLFISGALNGGAHDQAKNIKNPFFDVDYKVQQETGHIIYLYNMLGYEAMMVLRDAIQVTDLTLDPLKIKEERAKIRDSIWSFDYFAGLRGRLVPDGFNGYLRRRYTSLLIVEDGEFKRLDRFLRASS